MGKFEKKKKKKMLRRILIICLLVVAVCLAISVVPQALYWLNPDEDPEEFAETTASQIQETETQAAAEETGMEADSVTDVTFPVVLDNGNILVDSLFQFSGVNPDAEKQQATDVACIQLNNASGQFLREATVTATLANGNKLTFMVTDVPAGADVMAFSVDNITLLPTDICASMTVEAVFEDVSDYEAVVVSADGMTITVENTSSEDVNDLNVYYRDVFGDKYFGGKTYICNIENLSAGESMTIAAEESILGVIEVVRVAVNDKN